MQGKQWTREDLPVDSVREHKDFQFRLESLNRANLNRLQGALDAGQDARDPIRVARIGKVLYVVDGFHRLEAYRAAGRSTIPAEVAKMSLPEARDAARAFNAMNGKPYTRADREAAFRSFVAEGRHLDAMGTVRSCRAIAADLGGLYSYETVRKKLKAAGVELDEVVEYGGHYKPRGSEEDLEADLAEDAREALRDLGRLLPDLEPGERAALIEETRKVLEVAEGGERPDLQELLGGHLDI